MLNAKSHSKTPFASIATARKAYNVANKQPVSIFKWRYGVIPTGFFPSCKQLLSRFIYEQLKPIASSPDFKTIIQNMQCSVAPTIWNERDKATKKSIQQTIAEKLASSKDDITYLLDKSGEIYE
jgi:hypothetical protein